MQDEQKNHFPQPVSRQQHRGRTAPKPFDTSELQRLPYPNESDPPYRPFWVEDKN